MLDKIFPLKYLSTHDEFPLTLHHSLDHTFQQHFQILYELELINFMLFNVKFEIIFKCLPFSALSSFLTVSNPKCVKSSDCSLLLSHCAVLEKFLVKFLFNLKEFIKSFRNILFTFFNVSKEEKIFEIFFNAFHFNKI